MSINENLRRLRLQSGMTQEQVAEKIGVTRQALSSYESGRTRPDIDMLVRLGDVYGTDLEGIVSGQSHALKSARRVKVIAAVLFVLLTVSTWLSSALLWSANHFFVVPTGALSPEGRLIFASRQRLTGAWETMDQLILTLSLFGFLLLLFLLASGKCVIPFKKKLAYLAGLAAAVLIVPAIFGMTDPVFTVTDYMITPTFVVARMLLFFAAERIIALLRRRHGKHAG